MTRLISILLVVCFMSVAVVHAAPPTRFPNGVNNAISTADTGDMRLLDPSKTHMYWEDWDYYNSGNWTVTEVEAGAGSATQALATAFGDGGILLLTNAAGDNDYILMEKVGKSFAFAGGEDIWYKTRFKISDATQTDMLAGLVISGATSPVASDPGLTDGVFFSKSDGAATVDFIIRKNSVSTTASSIATMEDDTFIELALYYDVTSGIEYWVDGVQVGTSVVTNIPDDEIMIVGFGVQNGEAVAKTMSIDYIMVNKNR